MSEEEQQEHEEEKRKEEKRKVAKQLSTSFPKFLINGLIVIGLGLFYIFVVPLFIALYADDNIGHYCNPAKNSSRSCCRLLKSSINSGCSRALSSVPHRHRACAGGPSGY